MKLSVSDDVFLRLPALVRHHAIQLDNAAFNKDYFSSIVWAAVTLEALLEEILEALDQKASGKHGSERPDLGGMLSALEKVIKQQERNLSGAMELISRAHTIRATRNLIVHNTGRRKKDMRRQAETVCEDLSDILQWWIDEFAEADDPSARQALPRIFLATINPDHPRHRAFLGDLKQALSDAGMQPVTVQMTEYDRKCPLQRVTASMKECQAVLIVGLERSRAYLVCDREGTAKQVEDKHRRYSSAWLHMEAGLAYGLGFEDRIFVLCEQSIWSEGAFDRDWNQFTPVVMPWLDVELPAIRETIRLMKEVVSNDGVTDTR